MPPTALPRPHCRAGSRAPTPAQGLSPTPVCSVPCRPAGRLLSRRVAIWGATGTVCLQGRGAVAPLGHLQSLLDHSFMASEPIRDRQHEVYGFTEAGRAKDRPASVEVVLSRALAAIGGDLLVLAVVVPLDDVLGDVATSPAERYGRRKRHTA